MEQKRADVPCQSKSRGGERDVVGLKAFFRNS